MSLLFNMYQQPTGFVAGLVLVSLWSLVWKGLGLWHSSRSSQRGWFLAILIFDMAGLLPIVYLIWFKPQGRKVAARKVVRKSSKKKN